MSEQEIIEGNKLIAEFIGLIISDFYDDPAWVNNNEHWICEVGKEKYHSSWDWLIPVLTRIRKQGVAVQLVSNKDSIIHNFDQGFNYHFNFEFLEGEIINVWKAVIEFINWYNSCQIEK